MKPVDVNVDAIMLEIGHLGKYQIKLILWLIIPVVLCSMHDQNYIFTAIDVAYRCKISECEGINPKFNASWLSNSIPRGERCSRYALNGSSVSQQAGAECSANLFDKSKKISCNEYVFQEKNTFVEEFNIACEDWKITLVGTMQNVGSLVAFPFVGALSDRYGRRHTLIISSVVTGMLGIIKSVSVNYSMFVVMESLEPILGAGVFVSAFTIAIEIVIPSMREAINSLLSLYYVIGRVIMGFAGWAFPYWRTYLQVMYSPALLISTYYLIINDSIKWLITKRRYQKAINILTKIATENNKTLSDKALKDLNFNNKHKGEFDVGAVDEYGHEQKHMSALRLLLKSNTLVVRFLKISLVGIANIFCLVGLSINSSTVLQYSRYQNYILGAAVDIPGVAISYFSLRYFGRKKTIFTSLLIGGLSLCLYVFIQDLPWLALIAYLLGKCCVGCAFGSLNLYIAELFPTSLRQTIISTFYMMVTCGSILGTQTPLLNDYNKFLPIYVFAGSCLFSSVLVFNSPETLNKRLPETVEDSENMV